MRIFGRKKGVTDSEGKIRNFLKVGVYNNRGKIDEKRSGWVAEDFVEVDQNHINTLIQNLEKRIDKEKPKPEEKKSEPVDLEVKLIPEIRPPTSEIPEWVPSEPLAPLTIRDEKPEPKTPKITPKPPEPRVKLPELKPIVRMPESTKTEMNTEPVKPTTETTVKAPEARSSIHTIQNRDTIGEISRNISITPKEMMEASKPQVGTPLYITEPLAIPGANRLTPKTDTTPEKETPNTPIVKPKEKKAETAKSEVKPEEKKPETLKPEEKKPEVNPEPVKPQSINKKEEKPQPEPEKEIIKNSLGTVLEETTLNMLKKMSSNAKIAYQRMV